MSKPASAGLAVNEKRNTGSCVNARGVLLMEAYNCGTVALETRSHSLPLIYSLSRWLATKRSN